MFQTFLCTQTIGKGSPDSPEAPESLIEELGKTANFLEILFEEIGITTVTNCCCHNYQWWAGGAGNKREEKLANMDIWRALPSKSATRKDTRSVRASTFIILRVFCLGM